MASGRRMVPGRTAVNVYHSIQLTGNSVSLAGEFAVLSQLALCGYGGAPRRSLSGRALHWPCSLRHPSPGSAATLCRPAPGTEHFVFSAPEAPVFVGHPAEYGNL